MNFIRRLNDDINGMIGIVEPSVHQLQNTVLCRQEFKVKGVTKMLCLKCRIIYFKILSDEEPFPENTYTAFSLILYGDVSDNDILVKRKYG